MVGYPVLTALLGGIVFGAVVALFFIDRAYHKKRMQEQRERIAIVNPGTVPNLASIGWHQIAGSAAKFRVVDRKLIVELPENNMRYSSWSNLARLLAANDPSQWRRFGSTEITEADMWTAGMLAILSSPREAIRYIRNLLANSDPAMDQLIDQPTTQTEPAQDITDVVEQISRIAPRRHLDL